MTGRRLHASPHVGPSADPSRRELPVPASRPLVVDPKLRARADAHAKQRADHAIHGLERQDAALAARSGLWTWQALALTALGIAILAPAFLGSFAPLFAVANLISLVFLAGVILRLVALAVLATEPHRSSAQCPEPAAWPTYAVLVPMFREGDIAADAVMAMRRIDYPSDRLDIVFVCEETDRETRRALLASGLAPHMRIVVVPDSHPRTKPKALNYALTEIRAEHVVVFDAEDVPARRQLKLAAARFARAPRELACLQARLNTYNPRDSFLTRQFTIEYTALFDGLLPALQFLRLPIPLGGTSNHFRTQVLREVGGWDAFNVTEDADLGFRLTRKGYHIAILQSTTYEEAPADFDNWFRQRTRWLKGWLQTYAVIMRRPVRLVRELGLYRFLGLQVLAGGLLAATLLHPLTYGIVALALIDINYIIPANGGPLAVAALAVAAMNICGGMVSTLALAATGLAARRRWRLVPWILAMPVYWLLVSLAAYRAVGQLIAEARRPIHWEKTRHRHRLRRELATR